MAYHLHRFLIKMLLYFAAFLSISVPCFSQLSGTYVVDSSGTGQFNSLTEMAEALNNQGISGDVNIRIKSGTYHEKILLDIPGNDLSSSVTIESYDQDAGSVHINYTENTTDTSNYVIKVLNGKNFTFRNLTFDTRNADKGRILELGGDEENIAIENCTFWGNRNGEGIVFGLIVGGEIDYTGPMNDSIQNLTVRGNTFYYLSASINNVNSYIAVRHRNITVENNRFIDADAMVLAGVENITVKNNINYGDLYKVKFLNMKSCTGDILVKKNKVWKALLGVTMGVVEGAQDKPVVVKNNFLSGTDVMFSSSSNSFINFVHNSLYVNDDANPVAFYGRDDNIKVLNNIFYQQGEGTVLNIYNDEDTPDSIVSDYNCLYSEYDRLLMDLNNPSEYIQSMDTLRAMHGTEAHSIYLDPEYAADTNLHATATGLKGSAMPLDYVNEDIDGELRDENPDMGADEINRVYNMVIDSVSVTPQNAETENALQVKWYGHNEGDQHLHSPWQDLIYLSRDTLLDPDQDILLGHKDIVYDIPAGSDFMHERSLSLNIDSTGSFYVLVDMDGNHKLVEDHADNLGYSDSINITYGERPDLQVTDIETPDQINSGAEVTIRYTVTNAGTQATTHTWYDYIYMGTDSACFENESCFEPDQNRIGTPENPTGLAPGESYTRAFTFDLPLKGSGVYYFKVLTDGNDQITELEEGAIENGHTGGRISVTQSPLADLEITDFQIPSTAFSGDEVNFSYTVQNNGTAVTAKDSWYDYIYISTDSLQEQANINQYKRRKRITRANELEPDSSITYQGSIWLPFCEANTYYFYAVCDGGDHIMELSETNNAAIASGPLEAVLKPNPDFTIRNISFSASDFETEQLLEPLYEVHNEGFDSAWIRNNLHEGIYLSQTDTFNSEEAYKISTSYHFDTLWLSDNEFIERSTRFRLPDSIFGSNYYIYLRADDNNAFCETPYEDNNAGRFGPIDIALAPVKDLQVRNLQVSTTGIAGERLMISYELHNAGEGNTRSEQIVDSVFLVPEGETPQEKYYLQKEKAYRQIAAGDYEHVELSRSLPVLSQAGAYSIYIKTDATNQVYEHQAENNNTTSSAVFDVIRDDDMLPDLEVSNLNYTGNAASGDTISVSFQVRNTSETAPFTNNWLDKVALLNPDDSSETAMRASMRLSTLEGGQSYRVDVRLPLPRGKSGEYLLVAAADYENEVREYYNRNNSLYERIDITLSPWADLQPGALTHEDTLTAGQETLISWLADNTGDAAAVDTPWVDGIYLSRDRFPDDNDIRIYRTAAPGMLAAGEHYQLSENFRVPPDIEGEFYLIVRVDDRDEVYEHSDEDNNYLVSDNFVDVVKPLQADLMPEASSIDLRGSYTTDYTITNNGPNPVFGSWVDAIYLSEDAHWDRNDLLVGHKTYEATTAGLETGNSYQESFSGSLPFVRPGYYHIIIKSDVYNYIPETDIENNAVASTDSFYIDMITALTPNVPKDSSFDNAGGSGHYYSLDVPPQRGVLLSLDGHSQSASSELYYRHHDLPGSGGPFDYKGSNPFQPDQQIIVPSSDTGSLDYILAKAGYIPAGEFLYTILAETKTFGIVDVTPEHGGTDGIVTMDINGFDFSDSLQVFLQNDEDTLEAVHAYQMNTTLARAHLNLNRLDTGVYDVVLKRLDRGDTTIHPAAFTVEDTAYHDYRVDVVAPGQERVNREFDLQINYANNGNINDYDVFLYVAFYYGDYETDSLDIEYLGDGMSDRLPDEYRYHPFSNDALYEGDRASFFTGWFPVYPAGGHGQLSFRIKCNVPDTVHVRAKYFRNPISDIHFSGNLDDLIKTRFMRNYDSMFTNNQVAQNAGARIADAGCIDDPEAVEAMIYKGVRGHAEYVSGGIPGSPTEVATTLFMKGVKSEVNPDGHVRAENLYKDLTDERRDIVLDPTQGSSYDHLFRNLDKCLDTDQIIQDIEDKCLKATGKEIVRPDCEGCDPYYETVYSYTCPPEGPPPGGDPDDDDDVDIINPQDPNDIIGPAGQGAPRYIAEDQTLPYKIRFENVSSASAPAQNVEIDNPLDEDFNLKQFKLKSVSWGDTVINLPNTAFFNGSFELGPAHYNHRLELVAGLDPVSREAFWRFRTIDPETGASPSNPQAGFLPPNDSTGAGEGYVTYTIEAQEDRAAGTTLANEAEIIFDDEASIRTNTWINTIPGDVPGTYVSNMPRYIDTTSFVVSWQPDTANRYTMDVSAYIVYVSVNGGPYEIWINNTTSQRAVFSGEKDSTYRFYSRGISPGGDIEPSPDTADATVTLAKDPNGLSLPVDTRTHEMLVFPNPSDGSLYIQYYRAYAGLTEVQITDIRGNSVLNRTVDGTAGVNRLKLNDEITGLGNGMYLIKVITPERTYVDRWIMHQ